MLNESQPPAEDMRGWQLGRLLTAAARVLEHAVDTDVAGLGITHAGVRVLGVLAHGPLPQHELAVRCVIQDQTLSRIIDRLERDGHVNRRRDAADRRKVMVDRTASGEKVLELARQITTTHLNVFEQEEDTAATRRLLIKIIERLGCERWGCTPAQADPAQAATPTQATPSTEEKDAHEGDRYRDAAHRDAVGGAVPDVVRRRRDA